jgi:hypothetical protein
MATAYILDPDFHIQAPLSFPGVLPGVYSGTPTLLSSLGDGTMKAGDVDKLIKDNDLPLKKVQADEPDKPAVEPPANQLASDEEAERQHAGLPPSVVQEQPPPAEAVEQAPHAPIAEEESG